jgi:hypothetical protein
MRFITDKLFEQLKKVPDIIEDVENQAHELNGLLNIQKCQKAKHLVW